MKDQELKDLTQETVQRFWNKVDKKGPNECWLWLGRINNRYYGVLQVHTTDGRVWTEGAHRVARFLANGRIPKGLLVCHRCDNRRCVNPEHLFLGNQSDNLVDAARKGRLSLRSGLNAKKVKEIKSLLHNRMSIKSIAERFGVSYDVVSNIKRKKSWNHITETEEKKNHEKPREVSSQDI